MFMPFCSENDQNVLKIYFNMLQSQFINDRTMFQNKKIFSFMENHKYRPKKLTSPFVRSKEKD